MQANRAVSAREVAFRTALWRHGVRGYRVTSRLPGRPDVVFPALRLAIFVHGCFWHVCPTCVLPAPRANAAFWHEKFAENVRRDRKAQSALIAQGWTSLVIWEHEIRPDPVPRARRLAAQIENLRTKRRAEKSY
jgi:DNA mismatch endonuclease (patch repair protein)